jgi:hypothetical protein
LKNTERKQIEGVSVRWGAVAWVHWGDRTLWTPCLPCIREMGIYTHTHTYVCIWEAKPYLQIELRVGKLECWRKLRPSRGRGSLSFLSLKRESLVSTRTSACLHHSHTQALT